MHKEIKAGEATVEALAMQLCDRSLIVLRGSKGYIMCGYLNMEVAEKLKEAAVRITGVSTIEEALEAQVESCSSAAQKLGILRGQPVRDALAIIA